jgi:membrane protease YdiL (CAAX protease family)
MITAPIAIAALLALIPYLAAAFFGKQLTVAVERMPLAARLLLPAVLGLPYTLVAVSAGVFHWYWQALYALLPVALATVLYQARRKDSAQHGNWRDFLILVTLGLAVDLRWFEPAWPSHLAVFNKILLLDAGVYGFLMLRHLDGVGFDLRLYDLGIGLREFVFYAPVAVVLGLSLGFLHAHAVWPSPLQLGGALAFTFFFIAIPEELFFRGWLQNLLERRMGRYPALLLTAVLFGLSHWNKRTANFNWQYVLLAAIAGIFYGRAWRQRRRIGASAITHTAVDAVWSIWLL